MTTKLKLVILVSVISFSTIHSQDYEAIIRSIDEGNIEDFKVTVQTLDDLNDSLSNGTTLLVYSIYRERLRFIEYLLQHNADVEKAVHGYTPLMYSVYFYNPDIMQYMLSHGADPGRSLNGKTPLMEAITIGNYEAADMLIDNGAKLNTNIGPDGPHIFSFNSDTLIVISVTKDSKIKIDAFNIHNYEAHIYAPVGDSFMLSLREPEVETQSVFERPGKIFVLSDIEGNYIDFINILKNNGIIDNNLHWNFGDGHLVLLGDFVDRGEYVTQVLWLIFRLEKEAIADGGKVHFLLGNHELMNIMGDTRYVNEKYHILAFLINIGVRDFYSEYAFLGRWIRTKNVIEKIGDYIFVHAGISDSLLNAELTIPEINTIARNNMSLPDSSWSEKARLVFETYGVLWYRGFITGYQDYEKTTQASLDTILDYYDATHFVIGHTLLNDISTDYGGKVISIDVDHYNNNSSGIYIKGDEIYKATKTGERVLLE